MTLFERIADELEYQGLKRADLCRMTGISEGTIRGWQNTEPKAIVLLKVAQALNVSIEYLLTGQEKRIQKIQNTDIYSLEEKDMIQKYRSISDHDKNMVRTVLDTAYQASSQNSEAVRNEA